MRKVIIACALALICGVPSAFGHDYEIGALRIGHPYAGATLPGGKNGAAYLSVTNTGQTASRLTSASTTAAKQTELHESIVEGGIARMRPVERPLVIEAGATLKLEPRSHHLMLIGLTNPLVAGQRVKLVLSFEPEGDVEVELAIQPVAARAHQH